MWYLRCDFQTLAILTGCSEWFVDVNDCARLHVAALLDKSIDNQRIFAFAESVNWTDIVTILREIRPQNEKIPDPPVHEGRDLSQADVRHKAENILQSYWGIEGWTGLRESITAGVADIL